MACKYYSGLELGFELEMTFRNEISVPRIWGSLRISSIINGHEWNYSWIL